MCISRESARTTSHRPIHPRRCSSSGRWPWRSSSTSHGRRCWPSLILGVRRLRGGSALAPQNRALLIAVVGGLVGVSFAWSCWLTPHEQTLAYFSTLTRGWELGVGALLALAAPSVAPRAAKHHHLLVPLGFGWHRRLDACLLGGHVVSGLRGAAAGRLHGHDPRCWDRATQAEPGRAATGEPAVRGRRRVSYSFYLWHWPVLVIAAQYIGHPLSLAANLTLVGSGPRHQRADDPLVRGSDSP